MIWVKSSFCSTDRGCYGSAGLVSAIRSLLVLLWR